MPLLSGTVAVTRFDVTSMPSEIDFESEAFRQIAAGSEQRESIGFVPFAPGEPYQVGHRRWAFRVRIDRVQPDATAVRERLADLVRTELEASGAERVGPRKRKELKHLAEEEMLVQASPSTRIIEGVIDDRVLYLATTANTHLGRILQALRKVDVLADFKTPWSDLGEPEAESELIEIRDPVASAHGSRFLESLVGDREIQFEPVGGYVKLQTRTSRITMTGAILRDLHHYLDEEDTALLAAKLLTAETSFRLDALTFRISGLSLPRSRHDHWIEQLDERLEGVEAICQLLDRKYAESKKSGPKRVLRPVPVAAEANRDDESDAAF